MIFLGLKIAWDTKLSKKSRIPNFQRHCVLDAPTHVAHFWPIEMSTNRAPSNSFCSMLEGRIVRFSLIIAKFGKTKEKHKCSLGLPIRDITVWDKIVPMTLSGPAQGLE